MSLSSHRDVSLENFLFETKKSEDGKLEVKVRIHDFGAALLVPPPSTEPSSKLNLCLNKCKYGKDKYMVSKGGLLYIIRMKFIYIFSFYRVIPGIGMTRLHQEEKLTDST